MSNKLLPSEFDYNNDFNIMPIPPELKARELDLFMTIIKKIVDLNSRTIDLEFNEVFEYVANRGESTFYKMVMFSQFADKLLKWNIKYAVKDKNGIRFYAFVCFEKINSTLFADEYAEVAERFFKQRNRTFRITVQEDFFKMLINKEFGWTRADLKEYTWLSSKYAKRLYPLLKQWRNKGITRKYEWNEFKQLLNIPENYKISNINQRILKPAIKELMEQHNLFENSEDESDKRTIFEKLEFHKVKNKQGRGQGGKVEEIFFTFTPQREKTKEEKLTQENAEQAQKIERLEKQHERDKQENYYLHRRNAEIISDLGLKNKYEGYKGVQIKNNNGEMLKIVDIGEWGEKIEVMFKNQENETTFQKIFPTENHLRKYIETFSYRNFMPELVN